MVDNSENVLVSCDGQAVTLMSLVHRFSSVSSIDVQPLVMFHVLFTTAPASQSHIMVVMMRMIIVMMINKWFIEVSSYLLRSSLDPMLNVA